VVVILWYVESPAFQAGMDVFAIGHGLLHVALRNHPHIEFDSWFSRFLIAGGALFGALHLSLLL
jgi:hypothetical protein